MPALDLRPLSLGELLDRTFFLYRRNFWLFAGISSVPYVLLIGVVFVFVLLAKVAGPAAPIAPGRIPSTGLAAGAIVLLLLLGLIFLALLLLSAGAVVFAVAEIYAGRQPKIRPALRMALGRIWTIVGVTLLTLVICFAGALFLILPGIYLGCRSSVATAAALIDEIGPAEALRRSFSLTKGFAGRAFLIILLTAAISWALMAVFQVPFIILVAASSKDPQMVFVWTVIMEIGNLLGTVLVAPVSAIAFALYYYDLRVRKEAFDLQMMMQAIGADPAPPAVTGGVPSAFGRDAS